MELKVGHDGEHLLHGHVGMEIPLQPIGVPGVFHTIAGGWSLSAPGITMVLLASHGLPNAWVADAQTKL